MHLLVLKAVPNTYEMFTAPIQGERATGYGVALLPTLFGEHSESALLQRIAPTLPAQDPVTPTSNNNDHAATDGVDTRAPQQPSSKKTRLV